MKKTLILLALGAIVVSVLVCSGSSVRAEIPMLINYQGMLTDDWGAALTDTVFITFRIYNDSLSAAPIDKKWEEIHTAVPVIDGLFNVYLGTVDTLDLDFSEDYWLDVTVGTDHMNERVRFSSVAYAYRALVADSAAVAGSGGGGGGDLMADGTVPMTGNLDLDGNALILDADGDTYIESDTTDDQIDVVVGGTSLFTIVADTILPATHKTMNLGSDTKAFNNIYAKKVKVHGSGTMWVEHDGTNGLIKTETGKFVFMNEDTLTKSVIEIKSQPGQEAHLHSDIDGTTHMLICDKPDSIIFVYNVPEDVHFWATATHDQTLFIHGKLDVGADLTLSRVADGNTATISASALTSSYTLTLPVDDGTADQVLITDGSGTLSWSDAAAVGGDITAVGSMTSGDVFADATATGDWLGLGAAAGRIEFDDETTDEVNILDANVGIGTPSPTQSLDVNGNARIRSIGSGSYSAPVNQTSDGTLTTATSDVRLKKNVATIENALDKVLNLRGVTFNWKDDKNHPRRMTGMIAQEVIEVMPELVFQNPADGYYGINYGESSGLLIEAIKELKEHNEVQRNAISALQQRLADLELKVNNGLVSSK